MPFFAIPAAMLTWGFEGEAARLASKEARRRRRREVYGGTEEGGVVADQFSSSDESSDEDEYLDGLAGDASDDDDDRGGVCERCFAAMPHHIHAHAAHESLITHLPVRCASKAFVLATLLTRSLTLSLLAAPVCAVLHVTNTHDRRRGGRPRFLCSRKGGTGRRLCPLSAVLEPRRWRGAFAFLTARPEASAVGRAAARGGAAREAVGDGGATPAAARCARGAKQRACTLYAHAMESYATPTPAQCFCFATRVPSPLHARTRHHTPTQAHARFTHIYARVCVPHLAQLVHKCADEMLSDDEREAMEERLHAFVREVRLPAASGGGGGGDDAAATQARIDGLHEEVTLLRRTMVAALSEVKHSIAELAQAQAQAAATQRE